MRRCMQQCTEAERIMIVHFHSSSSWYRQELQYWNVTLTTVRFGQDSHLSRVYTNKMSQYLGLQVKTMYPVACYAVDGVWTTTRRGGSLNIRSCRWQFVPVILIAHIDGVL